MGDINPGYVFKPNDTLTADKLNQLVGKATLRPLSAGQVAGLQEALDARASKSQVARDLALRAPRVHTHATGDVAGLEAKLEQKTGPAHRHAMTEVEGLSAKLAERAPTAHAHPQTDVKGLPDTLKGASGSLSTLTARCATLRDAVNVAKASYQATLERKSQRGHTHSVSEVAQLQEALDKRASATHRHPQGHMAGLSAQFASKASQCHTHDVGQVNDVHGVLSGKADQGHRHSAMEIERLVIHGRAAGHNVQDPSAQVYMDALPTIDMALTFIRGTFANNSQ